MVNPYDSSILQKNDEPIKMQVGMKNKLSLAIYFQHKNYNCRGTLKGFIAFNYLNINFKKNNNNNNATLIKNSVVGGINIIQNNLKLNNNEKKTTTPDMDLIKKYKKNLFIYQNQIKLLVQFKIIK